MAAATGDGYQHDSGWCVLPVDAHRPPAKRRRRAGGLGWCCGLVDESSGSTVGGLAERHDCCAECCECPLDGGDLLGEASDLGECVVIGGWDRCRCADALLAGRQAAVGVVHGCLEEFRRGASCAVVVAVRAVAVDVLVEQALCLGFDVLPPVVVAAYLVADHAGDVVVADLVVDGGVHDGADDVG